jgi:hypothetical protein
MWSPLFVEYAAYNVPTKVWNHCDPAAWRGAFWVEDIEILGEGDKRRPEEWNKTDNDIRPHQSLCKEMPLE